MNERIRKILADAIWEWPSLQTLDLSKDSLTLEDIKILGEIIKKARYLESIKLPQLPAEKLLPMLDILNEAMAANSIIKVMELPLPDFPGGIPVLVKKNIDQIQSRIQRNQKKIFAIHGGGNIGLGLMADIISRSPFKYQTIATSNDAFLTKLINNTGQFSIQHKKGDAIITTKIKDVKIVSRESLNVIELYKTASIAAICLTPEVLAKVAKDIAQGLIARYQEDAGGLKILVLMNVPNCDQFVKEKVTAEIQKILTTPEKVNAILKHIQFVPTVVDRIVTKISEAAVKLQIREQFLQSYRNDIDYASLNAEIDKAFLDTEKLTQMLEHYQCDYSLFNAERNFVLYTPKDIPEVYRFPTIKPIGALKQLEAIKNKFINGPHAILAWIGALVNCPTIAAAIRYPGMLEFINTMMKEEIAPALKAEYKNLTDEELNFHRELFIERCLESTDDPVKRVGRDPLRKIDANGRIRGTIELSKKHQLKTSTARLEQGLSAAILYALKQKDSDNPGCQKINDIYRKNNGQYQAVLCYQGPSPSGKYTGLDPVRDKSIINNILVHIGCIEKNVEISEKRQKANKQSYSFFSPNQKTIRRFLEPRHKAVNAIKFPYVQTKIPRSKSDLVLHTLETSCKKATFKI